MTFANCPKCGASDVTTAGVCANCGWTRFRQVMGAGESKEVVYNLVGEIEIKMSGKALLDDYKRLLFENKSLESRIAELEEIDRMRSESVSTLNQANANNEDEIELLEKRIVKLEAKVAEQKALVQHQHLWQEGEDAKERAHLERLVPVLKSRIDVLDAKIKKSLYFIRKLRMYCFNANWDYSDPEEVDEFNEFDAEVCEYLSEYKEREE